MIPFFCQIVIYRIDRFLYIQHISGLTFHHGKFTAVPLQRDVDGFLIILGASGQQIVDRLQVKIQFNGIYVIFMLQIHQGLVTLNDISMCPQFQCFLHQLRILPGHTQISGCGGHIMIICRKQCDLHILQTFDMFFDNRCCFLCRHSGQFHIPGINSCLNSIICLGLRCHSEQHRQSQ